MRTAICVVAIVLFSMCTWRASMAQPKYPRVIAEFPGASLKWVHVAEPEFRKKGLNPEHYVVSVLEYKDTIDVSLTSIDASTSPEVRGSSGTYPAFDVEIAKVDGKVIRAYYVR